MGKQVKKILETSKPGGEKKPYTCAHTKLGKPTLPMREQYKGLQ